MNRARRLCLALAAAACALACLATAALAADEFEQYGLESAAVSLSSRQAGSQEQAGAHADLTVSFSLKRKENLPYAETRDIEVALPPGVIGNPQGIPRCSVAQLGNSAEASACPQDSQVGVTEITLGGNKAGTFIEPIYNMDPPGGDVVARLGFIAGFWPALLNVRVDPIDYSLVATVEGAPSAADVLSASTTLWGVPADPSHDEQRITPLEAATGEFPPGGREAGLPPAPFLSNPTDCSLQRQVTVTVRSYQLPGAPSSLPAPYPQIGGCGKLGFQPEFTAVPTNPEAAAPTGLDAVLRIPQDETPQGRATSTLKRAVVTLPEGLTVNPAAADGLAACSAAQVGFGTTEPSHCPDAAKIGSVELEVPALEHTLRGSVYQRTPEPGRLLGFWLVTDEQGVRLKLPAEIDADPLSGQLLTVFSGIPSLGGNPQVPFEELKLHVPGGPRAPLATPAGCGTYQTHYQFTPWSGRPAAEGDTPLQISSGCAKGGFDPRLSAGTLATKGGAYSPFVLTLTREDGEANPRTLAVHLPQGLLAKLAGVPLCPEAQAASGACPAASRVGSLTAAVGVGGAPLWIPQPGKAASAAFLAGPYKGAPYSIVSVVPAQAGPFDLGLVVNRAGIYVNPDNATATIRTDPLPQILEGIPVAYRTLNVLVDRPEFTLNPTGCARKQIEATLTAANGATATPSSPFQASDCARLRYRPHLKLRFKGATKRTGHPAVRAVLTQRPGQAASAAVTVLLPASEFIDQAHISNPCTRVQFNAGSCPKGSILGRVTAWTPLLGSPLKGRLYFRSNGGARELPDIVADLHGAGVHIVQVGFVDSVARKHSEKSRIRTRFLSFPDAPVSRVALRFFGGKRGLLVNSTPLCGRALRAKAVFAGQNGRRRTLHPRIATACGRHRSHKHP